MVGAAYLVHYAPLVRNAVAFFKKNATKLIAKYISFFITKAGILLGNDAHYSKRN